MSYFMIRVMRLIVLTGMMVLINQLGEKILGHIKEM